MAEVSGDVEVRGSALHGRGAFARRAFAAGEAVLRHEGIVVEAATLADDVKALQIGPALWLLADPERPHASDEVNHACDPNLGFAGGDLTLVALRPIAVREELTFDYSTALDQLEAPIPCACGGDRCRRAILGWSALPAEIREHLRPRALAWLQQR
ncbi:MAG: SET domain-containing protein-lysine N-methyltransferase [Nannocystaceae bacterium]